MTGRHLPMVGILHWQDARLALGVLEVQNLEKVGGHQDQRSRQSRPTRRGAVPVASLARSTSHARSTVHVNAFVIDHVTGLCITDEHLLWDAILDSDGAIGAHCGPNTHRTSGSPRTTDVPYSRTGARNRSGWGRAFRERQQETTRRCLRRCRCCRCCLLPRHPAKRLVPQHALQRPQQHPGHSRATPPTPPSPRSTQGMSSTIVLPQHATPTCLAAPRVPRTSNH